MEGRAQMHPIFSIRIAGHLHRPSFLPDQVKLVIRFRYEQPPLGLISSHTVTEQFVEARCSNMTEISTKTCSITARPSAELPIPISGEAGWICEQVFLPIAAWPEK